MRKNKILVRISVQSDSQKVINSTQSTHTPPPPIVTRPGQHSVTNTSSRIKLAIYTLYIQPSGLSVSSPSLSTFLEGQNHQKEREREQKRKEKRKKDASAGIRTGLTAHRTQKEPLASRAKCQEQTTCKPPFCCVEMIWDLIDSWSCTFDMSMCSQIKIISIKTTQQ